MSDYQTKFSTDEVEAERVSAGEINEDGVFILFRKIDSQEGKHGEYHSMIGETEDGKLLQIDFSSKRLKKLLTIHYQELKDKKLKIKGIGKSFERKYEIEIIP
ncbi:MAG: hypothetical protein R6V50_02295 [Thermoplasmatota archaeon]